MRVMASQTNGISTVCTGAHQIIINTPRHWHLLGESSGGRWITPQRVSKTENVSIKWHHHALHFLSGLSKTHSLTDGSFVQTTQGAKDLINVCWNIRVKYHLLPSTKWTAPVCLTFNCFIELQHERHVALSCVCTAITVVKAMCLCVYVCARDILYFTNEKQWWTHLWMPIRYCTFEFDSCLYERYWCT